MLLIVVKVMVVVVVKVMVVKVMVVVVNDEVLSMSLFGYGEVHVCLDRKVYVYLGRCMFV